MDGLVPTLARELHTLVRNGKEFPYHDGEERRYYELIVTRWLERVERVAADALSQEGQEMKLDEPVSYLCDDCGRRLPCRHCPNSTPGMWRVGRSVGRTLYVGDQLIGVMDTSELAELVVEAVNAHHASHFADQP